MPRVTIDHHAFEYLLNSVFIIVKVVVDGQLSTDREESPATKRRPLAHDLWLTLKIKKGSAGTGASDCLRRRNTLPFGFPLWSLPRRCLSLSSYSSYSLRQNRHSRNERTRRAHTHTHASTRIPYSIYSNICV